MKIIYQDELPFKGMSHSFVGEDQGVDISFYLVNAEPGRGPALHTHPYDKIMIVQEGRSLCTAGGERRELRPGDIALIRAGEPHCFLNIGNGPLRQIDIHLSPRFVQEQVAS